MGDNRARENDTLKQDLSEVSEQLASITEKYRGALARKKTLETEMKTVKGTFESKIKILLGKTKNDDNLIAMLKNEIKKLENGKSGSKGLTTKLKLSDGDTMYSLKNENGILKNNVIVLETELTI
jgi:hypothetical protein